MKRQVRRQAGRLARRVVVTGVGSVSSAGASNEALLAAVREGKRCFTPLSDSRLERLAATHAGLIREFEAAPSDPTEVRGLDRVFHLALRAFREAISGAGLDGEQLGERTAAVVGTCSGGMLSIEDHYRDRIAGKPGSLKRLFSRRYYTIPKVLAWAAGITGPAFTVVTACAAGSGAIAQGADLIRVGLVDRAVVGGADTFAPSTLVGFDALKATCEGMCAPFSTNIGLNLGEGAAFLVLEDEALARERGAPIFAEILGYGLSNDAYHPTAPDPSLKGQTAAIRRALDDAGVVPDEVDYVNAHGTGTRANDPIESKGILRVLGNRAEEIPVSSTKSIVGHCLGAAGAIEAVSVILAAGAGIVPPTAGFDGHREGCNLADYVGECGREWKGRVALSNSFGFGGNNATVVMDVQPSRSSRHSLDISKGEGGQASSVSRDLVITGIGVVSPTGLQEITRFDANGAVAGLVPSTDPKTVDRRLDLRGMDLCSAYATLASRKALSQAGFKPRPKSMENLGMVLGIATGPSKGEKEHVEEVIRSGFTPGSLGAFPYVVPNSVSGHVARTLFLRGYNTVLSTGLGAGLAATISAAVACQVGHTDAILAVASDELSQVTYEDGVAAGRFGGDSGIAPGEGAVAVMIEDAAAAEKRGATILAAIAGFGSCTDAGRPLEGDGDVLERAKKTALERASLAPDDIHHRSASLMLTDKIGLAEAALPLFNLHHLLVCANPGENVLVTSESPEGLAHAAVFTKQ